jgi:hypothetical protein
VASQEWGSKRMEERGQGKSITFNLSGTPDNALGSREERMFCIMVDAAATPQTLPIERKRYTIDVETACSARWLVILSHSFFSYQAQECSALTRLLKRCDVGEKDAWEDYSLTEIRWKEVHDVFPAGVMVFQCCHDTIPD